MRFMVMVKATKGSEAGALPDKKLLETWEQRELVVPASCS
jgi:hypothetical protein